MSRTPDRLVHRIEAWLRLPIRSAYLAALHRAGRRAEALPRAGSAIVFAPHPDDETLACGGTIAALRADGTRVVVVVMTDGAAQHAQLIDPARLKAIRAAETRAAASALGLAPDDLVFLEFPDQDLRSFERAATARAGEILAALRPQLVFIPYRHDVHPDHEATSAIVHAALELLGDAPIVYEYPVWFLYHWPLVEESPSGRIPVLSTLRWGALRAARMLRDFRSAGSVRAFLDRKRAALACYPSQTTRLIADPRWQTLADLSHGEFLALFLGDYELFRRVDAHSPRGGNANA